MLNFKSEGEVSLLPGWIKKIGSWFWYRQGKVRYHIWLDEDSYIASASNGDITVYNYGSTPEIAKETALLMLRKALNNEEEKERKFITKGNGYVLYRIK